ncbi:MFS transporter [Shinella sumterensis]|uniref:MFS transporter n=1 Tax=Shinella sumterensis TaxID=1967501 RepID=UPI00106E92E9|nr:MFS transporter [Shinella sumterensis]MCD1263483.1 MFS transporter [Shinella sumterensis]TFE97478.1 MFS transporter [Shinella sumterensis]
MTPPSGFRVTTGAPPFFAVRIALVFCAPMMVNGIALPFFPVWLETLSLTDFQIGIVLAVPLFVRVFTAPVAGVIADRIGERSIVLLWSGLLSLLTALALFATGSFWPILLLYTLQGAVYSPYVPITEAIMLSGVRRWNFDYGRMRLWGSLAFIVATMGGGWLAGLYGGAMVLPAMAAAFVLTVVGALIAPKIGKPRRPSPIAAIATMPTKSTLRQSDVQLMLIGVSLVNASHAMLFAFSAIYWQKMGFSGVDVGILWSAGVLAEVVFFLLAVQLRRRFNLWSMMIVGASVAVVRWIVFPMEMSFAGYFALQCLHAFTYALIHMSAQSRLVQRVAEEQEAAAQGLYFFYTGIFTALATFVSGYAFSWYGVQGFYLMSLVAAAGLICVLAGRLLAPSAQPQSAGSGG